MKSYFEGDYLGVGSTTDDSATAPYGNTKDFYLENYDIKDVDADELAELPEYDFSGPSNFTNGLNSESMQTSNTQVGTGNSTGITVYLAPIYSGETTSYKLPQTMSAYKQIKKAIKKSKLTYTQWMKKNFKASDYKGYSFLTANSTGPKYKDSKGNIYRAYHYAWNMCLAIGDELQNAGYDVKYFADGTAYKDFTAKESVFTNTIKELGWNKIATTIEKENPDIVLLIGYNNYGFSTTGTGKSNCGTKFVYTDIGGGSEELCEALNTGYSSDKNVTKYAPAFSQNATDLTSVKDKQEEKLIEECYTALEIAGYSGNTGCILFGNFNSQIKSTNASKAKYDYEKNSSKYAAVISKALDDWASANVAQK